MSKKKKGPVLDPPVQDTNETITAPAADPTASPADMAGVKNPACLYRFEFRNVKNGATEETVWIEVKAREEKAAWDSIPSLKQKHNIPDAEYSGRFEIHELKEQ